MPALCGHFAFCLGCGEPVFQFWRGFGEHAHRVRRGLKQKLWVFMAEIIIMVFIIKDHNSDRSYERQPQRDIRRIPCGQRRGQKRHLA
jgi:hypothetical protein